jgi:hypothetical protein
MAEGMKSEPWEYLGFKHPVHFTLFIEDKSFVFGYVAKLRDLLDMTEGEREDLLNQLVTDTTILSPMVLMNDMRIAAAAYGGPADTDDDEEVDIDVELEEQEDEDSDISDDDEEVDIDVELEEQEDEDSDISDDDE